nr:hypothetical protein [Streptomyces antibioticus]
MLPPALTVRPFPGGQDAIRTASHAVLVSHPDAAAHLIGAAARATS